MPAPREIRIFIASPGDVVGERERLERVVVRLNREFTDIALFRVIRWEHNFYTADQNFQDQITEPAECNVVVVIFGNRLGSELPDDFARRLPDGSPYPSGTAYELMSAVAAAEANRGRPAVYVFRTTSEPQFGPSRRAEWEAASREKERLDTFFDRWFRTPGGGFRRAFHFYTDVDDFAAQTDELLRQWAGLSLKTAPGWQIDRDGSPFRGLEQFDARHSRVFFGRNRKVERATDELIRAPARERGRAFLLVVGPSGSGKSSLVRAGLVPLLTGGNLVKAIDLWRVAVMKPGGGATAFAALAQALFVDGSKESDPGGFGPALPELAVGPYKSPAQLAEVLEAAPAAAAAPILSAIDTASEAEKQAGGFARAVRTDLLLVVDQLEEIFAGSVSEQQRSSFARMLTALADSGRVWIVATLRADLYLNMLDPKSPFLALKDSGGLYDLASPGQAELSEILQKSAEAAGLTYGKDPTNNEALDDRLLRDASSADSLPLLEFSLNKLFEARTPVDTPTGPQMQLTVAAYEALGGLDGAINTVAEETIRTLGKNLSNDQIDQALARLLRRMAVKVGDERSATTSQPGLTVRTMPLAEATQDEWSRTLVEILVHARLFVSDSDVESKSGPKAEPFLRLAHERVLTSWKRARSIVQAHREYFRIRADIEQEQRRWEAGEHRRELLLSAGTPLQDAERIVRDFRDELPAALRDYVAMSGRRARFRQRITAAAATVFFIVAVFASAFALLAYSAEQKATRNYEAAMGAASQLASSIGGELGKQKGLKSETLDIAFDEVDRLIQSIQNAVAQQDWYVPRQLQAGFSWVEASLGRAAPPGGDNAAFERSRAILLYEFAETYHQSANDLGKARSKAEQSLAIRTRLRDAGDTSPDMVAGIAMAEMELGDLDRLAIDQAPRFTHPGAPPVDYSKARSHFAVALQLLEPLTARLPQRIDLAWDHVQILTRLGDLDLKDGKREIAAQRYTTAQTVALRVFRETPNDPGAAHELAWSYRKLAEVQFARPDVPAALQSFTNEVCVRRRLVALRPDNVLWLRDLGWALSKRGGALLRLQPPDLDGALDADYEALLTRLDLADAGSSQRALFEDFGLSLKQIADVHRARGEITLADVFAAAAADVRQQIPEAFHDQYPDDDAARTMLVRQENLMRQRGVLAMIGATRQTVEATESEFARTRLDRLRQEARGCWDRLVRSMTPAQTAGGQP